MQAPSENHDMRGIAVGLLSEDREHLSTLQDRLRPAGLGREVFSHIGFPVSATDTIIRQLQESRVEVVIVDVPFQSAQRAIAAIELIHATTQIAILANGDLTQTANIVASMRNGASEYVDRSAGQEVLLEALARFSSLRTRALGAKVDVDLLLKASALARLGGKFYAHGFTFLKAGEGYVVVKGP